MTHHWPGCFRLNWVPFPSGKKRPEMGLAPMSRARTPATQLQRPSHLVASTLRAVGHIRPRRFGAIACPLRRQIIGGRGGCYVLKAQVFRHVWAVIGNGSCLPTALPWGFCMTKRESCFVFWFLVPQESASRRSPVASPVASPVNYSSPPFACTCLTSLSGIL